jgi:hypothetical protein
VLIVLTGGAGLAFSLSCIFCIAREVEGPLVGESFSSSSLTSICLTSLCLILDALLGAVPEDWLETVDDVAEDSTVPV